MSKRSVKNGSKVLIIDDFMRGGGSVTGIAEMMNEFDSKIVGVGIAIVSKEPEKKKVSDYVNFVDLGKVDPENKLIEVSPNPDIFKKI